MIEVAKIGGKPTVSQAGFGCGTGISLASLRRFWAVAARRNSSWAPGARAELEARYEDPFRER